MSDQSVLDNKTKDNEVYPLIKINQLVMESYSGSFLLPSDDFCRPFLPVSNHCRAANTEHTCQVKLQTKTLTAPDVTT